MATPDRQKVSYRYEIEAEIGAGGMGQVYRARDLLTNHTVALKRLHVNPQHLRFNSRTREKDLRLAIAREFRILASLRHPNIISVLDYGFDDTSGQPFFTMELLEEVQELREAAKERDRLGKIALIIQLLQALMYLHRRGIVHRDLKPANIVVDARNRVRVLDFGLAIEPDQQREVAGTLAYIAPEVLKGSAVTPAADLYAVGVMTYELLQGEHPFNLDDESRLVMEILTSYPAIDIEGLSPEIELIIERLISKEPFDRYTTAQQTMLEFSIAIGQSNPDETIEIRDSFIQSAKFIGREEELRILGQALDDIGRRDPQGSGWLIGGESGVGKSRLMEELRIRALVQGATVLMGQMQEGVSIPYLMWRDVVKQLVLMTNDISDQNAKILEPIVPDIAQLIGRQLSDDPLPDSLHGKQVLINTISELVAAQTKPLVIIMEDLQWASESIDVLKAISQMANERRLLLIANYRDDERPNLPNELPQMNALKLERLQSADIAALSQAMLGDAGTQADVVELIEKETEGNVFFIVEVVRQLANDAGRLSQIGRMTLPANIYTSGIQRIVEQRLDRVPAHYRSLLDIAAVSARYIDEPVLAHIHGGKITNFLYACDEAAVLDVRDDLWRFTHDKIRESVLALIPDEEMPRLHRKIALATEVVHADELDNYTEALATHWRVVGDVEKESHYVIRAAQLNDDRDLYRNVITLYERALQIKAHQYTDNPDLELAHIYYGLGNAHQSIGKSHEAIAWHDKALAQYQQAENLLGQAKTLSALGDVYQKLGNLDKSNEIFPLALELTIQSGDKRQLGHTYMNLSVMEYRRNDIEKGLAYAQKCYEIFEELGDERQMSKALNNLGLFYEMTDSFAEGYKYHQRSLAIRRRNNDRYGMVSSLVNIAVLMTITREDETFGTLEDAKALLTEALEIIEQFSMGFGKTNALGQLGYIANLQGNLNEARDYMQKTIEITRNARNDSAIAHRLDQYGHFERMNSYYSEALPAFQESLRLRLKTNDDPYWRYRGIVNIGMTIVHLNQREKAAEILAYVLDINTPDNLDNILSNLMAEGNNQSVEELRDLFTDKEWEQGIADAKAANHTLESLATWLANELEI